MKKLIVVLLCAALCATLILPAMAEEMVAGGWSATADSTVTEEVQTALTKAIEGMAGSQLEPIAVLGTQVVAGTNYCILCRSTPVVPDPIPSYVLVYLYDGVDGTAEILGITDVSIEPPQEVQ